MTVLAFGIKDIEVAGYHYQFYSALAALLADHWPAEVQERFYRTIREELSGEVHGEVDEKSWHLKQALLRRQKNVRKENQAVPRVRPPGLRGYPDALPARHLLRHRRGNRPRQMPSRYLRRRLELLISLFPPPEGYAVLPEQLKAR